MNDAIGKAGVEKHFERTLRGFHGKKSYYSDARGNFLRELPGRKEPQAGNGLAADYFGRAAGICGKIADPKRGIGKPNFAVLKR